MGKNTVISINQANNQTIGGKTTMKKSMKNVISTASALAIMGATLIGGQAAFAETNTQTVITGVPVTMEQPTINNFESKQLNGETQTVHADMNSFVITDASGTGDGWNVVLKADPFVNPDAPKSLSADLLSISAPKVEAIGDSSSALDITKTGASLDATTGVKILSAPADGGMGKYNVTFDPDALSLTLKPKDVYAGTYTSTITLQITATP